MFHRQKTRTVHIGKAVIGGGKPVLVQSMTNTPTRDVARTVRQIHELEDVGCEIVRVGVPDLLAARALGQIKKKISIPLVADIHFDYRLALEAISQGVDKLRINPGNIGSRDRVEQVVMAAKKAKVPIRIGVNAGSLAAVHKRSSSGDIVKDRAKKLVGAALEHIAILESFSFFDIAVSLKASDVATTVAAYRLLAAQKKYPLHLGITEAGSLLRGTVKSSVGLGILLFEGLGDTIRVSLTANPVEEIKVAYHILQSLGLRSTGVEVISCPTCSRCEVDLIGIVNELEDQLSRINLKTSSLLARPVKIAVMGCAVNGPGEAKEADIGIAGAKKTGILFKKGIVAGTIPSKQWVSTLIKYIKTRR